MESVASGAAAEAAGWIPDLSLAASCQRVCLQNRNMCIERKKNSPTDGASSVRSSLRCGDSYLVCQSESLEKVEYFNVMAAGKSCLA